jgi:hypothetical protein
MFGAIPQQYAFDPKMMMGFQQPGVVGANGPDGKPLTPEQMAFQTQQIIYLQQQAI